jgi:serine/threonine protein kinase
VISNGTLITLQNSKLQGTIGVLLGSGSQGEVYSFDIQDNRYAAKVYFLPTSTPDQIEIIRRLIDIKPPSERFLWPIDMFYTEDNRFGYIMSIRGKEYKSLSGLLKGQYDPSFLTLIECSLNLVKSFWSLHSQGLCYRDISLGNIFFNPKNGDIRICDNDNVFFDTKEKSGVFGTFRFMAPEIITKGLNPNTNTDLFSLSVLLFYILYMHHPLEGQREYNIHCLDIPAMKKLYGTHPVYIFDPDDDSNRPMIGYQDNPVFFFKTYPTFFNRMFEKVFTEGITKPNRRVRETIMQKTLLKLLNTLYKCPFCHSDNFLDSEKEKNVCWKCKKPIDPPFVLRYDQEDIQLYLIRRL